MLELLKPKNVNHKKIRLGPLEDGGYVMPEIVLEKCVAVMTYGVGHNYGYEDEFVVKYNKPAYMYDHTNGQENWVRNNVHFFKEGLGFENNCKDACEHYKELNLEGDIFLKVDIEGGEYDYFLNANIENIASFTNGLSLEIHWIDDAGNRAKFVDMMSKLNKFFMLCHVHGNNWGGTWEFEGFTLPKVFELSFINKKLVEQEEIETSKFPIEGLDIPNNPKEPDYQLTYIN
jgi:hypothetical protein